MRQERFKMERQGLVEEGQQVVVGGSVEVYERDGKYQLYAREIILDGAGYLYEKFERLKKELAQRRFEQVFTFLFLQAKHRRNVPEDKILLLNIHLTLYI